MTSTDSLPDPEAERLARLIQANQRRYEEKAARREAKVAQLRARARDARRQGPRSSSGPSFLQRLLRSHETRRPGLATTTAQTEAVFLATAEPSLGARGVLIGKELFSGQGFVYDPFVLYGEDLPGPNVLVAGNVGSGKSLGEKTYALRQIRFGRQVAVLDSKDQQGEGEWAPICRALGVAPVRFARNNGVRINPLDPRILRGADAGDDAEEAVGQDALLRTIAEVALRRRLTPEEGYALREAHAKVLAAPTATGLQPTLPDLIEALFHPTQESAKRTRTTLPRLVEDGRKVALELDRMCRGDLRGLVDGPTSLDVDLSAPLLVFDLSALDSESDALPVVMAVIGTFLQSTWVRPDGRKRIFIVEEGWHVIGNLSTARLFRRLWKLARGLGLQNIAVVHRLSDLVAGADDELRAAIAALLKEAQTRKLYRSDTSEMVALAREVLAQAPVPVESFDGFDPADLEGSLDRLAAFNRRSAKQYSGIYRDLVVRKRKTEIDSMLRDLDGPIFAKIGEIVHDIEQGRRIYEVRNLDELAAFAAALPA